MSIGLNSFVKFKISFRHSAWRMCTSLDNKTKSRVIVGPNFFPIRIHLFSVHIWRGREGYTSIRPPRNLQHLTRDLVTSTWTENHLLRRNSQYRQFRNDFIIVVSCIDYYPRFIFFFVDQIFIIYDFSRFNFKCFIMCLTP